MYSVTTQISTMCGCGLEPSFTFDGITWCQAALKSQPLLGIPRNWGKKSKKETKETFNNVRQIQREVPCKH